MGAFAVSGNLELPNFIHVVMNNGVHESVGGQPSVGLKINFTQIAKYSGYKTVDSPIKDGQELLSSVDKLLDKGGPSFIEVFIRKGMRSKLPPLDIIPEDLKQELMNR
jgi:phosphonopyruvate decarboxylase